MFILSVLFFSSYVVPAKILPVLPQVQQNASPANKQKQSCLVENSETAQQPILSQMYIYINMCIYIYISKHIQYKYQVSVAIWALVMAVTRDIDTNETTERNMRETGAADMQVSSSDLCGHPPTSHDVFMCIH